MSKLCWRVWTLFLPPTRYPATSLAFQLLNDLQDIQLPAGLEHKVDTHFETPQMLGHAEHSVARVGGLHVGSNYVLVP